MSNLEGYEASNARRHQINPGPKASELVEVIRKTSTGGDQRTGETFYKYEKLGVYSSKQAAMEDIIRKYCPDLSIQPLELNG